MSLLEVDKLCVEFSTRRGLLKAINQVSFELEKGEFLGMVGELSLIHISEPTRPY